MQLFLHTYLKLFFILTPFFVISVFLVMTRGEEAKKRASLAVKVTVSVMAITMIMLWFGDSIFGVFGITLDAFRIGAGVMLFLSALTLAQGKVGTLAEGDLDEMAVVPLALPVTVGPGTIGVLLVMGTELKTIGSKLIASGAMAAAVVTVGIMLIISTQIEKIIGRRGIAILSRITGLFVASIAAQLIFTGIRNFFK